MTATHGVRVAIVGAGLMGGWHARAARRAGARIVAVVDRDAARGALLADQHGAASFTSVAQAAAALRFDAAHVCVPVADHVPAARAVLEARAHALVEKPLAATAADTELLLRDAAAAGLTVCPVHQFPFQRGMRDVARLVARIGPVRHLRFEACSAGANVPDQRDAVAADILPHPLSLFAAVLDAPMAAVDWSVLRGGAGELLATGVAGDVALSVMVSMAGRPTMNVFRVIGERGTAHLDLYHGFMVVEPGQVSRGRKIARPFALAATTFLSALGNLGRRAVAAEPAYPGLRELVVAFYAGIAGRAASQLLPARTLDIAVARDSLLARLGRPA